MLKKILGYLLFPVCCLAAFALVNQISGVFFYWFARLITVQQLLVFGMAGSLLWLLSAGLTRLLLRLGMLLNLGLPFISGILFLFLLGLFGFSLFHVWIAYDGFSAKRLLAIALSLVMTAEVALYPLFILPAQIKQAQEKTGLQQ